MKKNWIYALIVFAISCKTYKPNTTFEASEVNNKINYSHLENWAAHPSKLDLSDLNPNGDTIAIGIIKPVDVFFLYPTIYIGDKGEDQWNAAIDDLVLNNKIDKSTILFQASAFNEAGNVYSPRYRQAHLEAYFTDDTISARKALELAYQDCKNAFLYYLKYDNKGRPFILASHSQGTNHLTRLMAELIDRQPLQSQLVASYLVGMPIKRDRFKSIPPCQSAVETGCFVSWRTYKYDNHPDESLENISVTNPITWTTDDTYAPKEQNMGSLLEDFNVVYPSFVDAKVAGAVLWAHKPKFKGSIFFTRKNYHIADINFYYFDIKANSALRAGQFVK